MIYARREVRITPQSWCLGTWRYGRLLMLLNRLNSV